MEFNLPLQSNQTILALGPESAGNFSVFTGNTLYLSDTFGDLLEPDKFSDYKKALARYLKTNKFKPGIILTDLHPAYVTSVYGQELARKYQAELLPIQHHLAHIFSAVGDQLVEERMVAKHFIGIGADGTGLGDDQLIWGGEVFEICLEPGKRTITRIGHLENQVLIGGDLAIREPARMLISILSKFLDCDSVYELIKVHYSRKVYDLLASQLEQRFNCFDTSSTGRILDATSVLLGFANNIRQYKHEPIDLLEKNSAAPYTLKPLVLDNGGISELQTTHLFEYLVKNLNKDRRRLAATAQCYLGEGFYEMAHNRNKELPLYFAGGMANNRLISASLAAKGTYLNKKIPRGDGGISFGQIIYYLLTNPGD